MDAEQKAAAEKANEVFGAIADDMLARTGGDVWGTQPPAEDSQPAPAPVADDSSATPPAEPAKEPTSEQPPAKIWGKYNSLEEAERGYHEAVRMGNEAKAQADRLAAELAAKTPAPTAAPEPDPLDDFETYGVPRKLIETAIDTRAKAKAQEAIQEYFAPALARVDADQKIIQTYPEYQEKFGDIESYVMSQPEIRSQVEALNSAGNFLAARQIAYLNWKVAQTETAVAKAAEVTAARTEEVKDARLDAGVGKTRRADSRTVPAKQEKSPEEFERLKTLYRNGHQTPLLRAMFDDMLPPDFDKVTAQ